MKKIKKIKLDAFEQSIEDDAESFKPSELNEKIIISVLTTLFPKA